MYYLAYGSNLSVKQMAARCPEAKIIGKAMLKDYRLVFRTHANVEKCKGSKVPVIIWDISETDEKSLDRYEGYPRYYTKKFVEVRMTNLEGKKPKKISAMVYVMNNKQKKAPPSWDYYGIIAEGYHNFGFDDTFLLEALAEVI